MASKGRRDDIGFDGRVEEEHPEHRQLMFRTSSARSRAMEFPETLDVIKFLVRHHSQALGAKNDYGRPHSPGGREEVT